MRCSLHDITAIDIPVIDIVTLRRQASIPDSLDAVDAGHWSVSQLAEYLLSSSALARYVQVIDPVGNGLTGRAFLQLTDEKLAAYGVADASDRAEYGFLPTPTYVTRELMID